MKNFKKKPSWLATKKQPVFSQEFIAVPRLGLGTAIFYNVVAFVMTKRKRTANKSKLDRTDMRTYPVQRSPCITCPFAGKKPLYLAPDQIQKYMENLVGFQGQHICHTTQANVCRGGRDIQIRLLCALGRLSEPTDAAFDRAVQEAMDRSASAT